MHLHKAIPLGAGLGGGSADAAFTLKLLNEKFLLELSNDQIKNYALELGSDCTFFLYNEPCFATGRGEQLEPVTLNLSAYKMLLVNQPIHIDTAWAYSKIKPVKPEKALDNYTEALALGGTKTLPQLYETAGLKFDFSPEHIKTLMEFVNEELAKTVH